MATEREKRLEEALREILPLVPVPTDTETGPPSMRRQRQSVVDSVARAREALAAPEAPEEGGDPWEVTEEDIEAAWPPSVVSPWRTALILRDRLRARVEAARTPAVSPDQWDALKQAIRTSDTHGRQYAAGLGLTITDHPSEEPQHETD